jgi:hypothetical protein
MSELPDPDAEQPAAPPAPLLAPLPPPRPAPRRSGLGNFLGVLKAGLRLALLRQPRVDALRLGPGLFWLLILLCELPLSLLLDYFNVEAPRRFSRWGLESLVAYDLLTVFVAFLLARLARRAELLWPLAALLAAAGLYTDNIADLAQHHLAPLLADRYPRLPWLVYWLYLLWVFLLVPRLLRALQAMRLRRALFGAAAAVACFVAAAWLMPPVPLWYHDYSAERAGKDKAPPLVAEEVFGRQDELLERALAGIAPSRPGRPSLYFVAYAPDGEQDVFMKEARYGTRLFQTRFGAAQRSLALVNNRQTVDELPLATAANLRHALDAIGRKMDPRQDILFLYLTSHGSRDARLAVELEGLSFSDFNAPRLAQMLKDSGIRWKVVVVSACYSGSFLDSLRDDHTLVLTAARADRTSFGCADDADFTYFGRAYLQQALNHTTSFTEAFAEARRLVEQWENRDHEVHSEPQMAAGALIGARLEQWRATLPQAPLAGAATAARAGH